MCLAIENANVHLKVGNGIKANTRRCQETTKLKVVEYILYNMPTATAKVWSFWAEYFTIVCFTVAA